MCTYEKPGAHIHSVASKMRVHISKRCCAHIPRQTHKPSTISQANWDLLQTIYAHPHHIDLFVGGLAEDPVSDGLTGPVFNAIKLKQFKNLMFGDRFFFTHKDQPGSFTSDAQKHIMDRQLSDIICDNTSLEKVPQNVFNVWNTNTNRYKTCSTSVSGLDISQINLL